MNKVNIFKIYRRATPMRLDKQLIFICMLFSFLFMVALPVSISPEYQFDITVTALGTHSPEAKSAEVWIASPEAKTIQRTIINPNEIQGWEEKYNKLVSYRNQPSALSFVMRGEKSSQLIFSTHEYSGNAAIKINGKSLHLELFSVSAASKKIELAQFADEGKKSYLGVISKLVFFFLMIWLALITCAHLMTSQSVVKTEERTNEIYLHRALAFSLPSIFIFGVVHLAYWPAQMSPDSIDQWQQAVTGHYSDNHPFLSTIWLRIVTDFSVGPAIAVALQYFALAIALGFLFAEFENWGIGQKTIWATAVVVPAFPATALVATTLWKDVPYAAGFTYIIFAILVLLRKQWQVSNAFLLSFFLASALLISVRHNGILVAPFVLWIAGLIQVRSSSGRKLVFLGVGTVVFFALMKAVINPLFEVQPLGRHYSAMNAIHIIGGMVHEDIKLDQTEKKLVDGLMPIDSWKKNYVCQSVVSLFWGNGSGGFDYINENASALNMLAIKLILAHPTAFLKHYSCVSAFLWRIGPRTDDWIPISPGGITLMPDNVSYGLINAPKLPAIKQRIDNFTEKYVINSSIFGRSSIYLLSACFLISIYSYLNGKVFLLLLAPFAFHTMSLAILAAAPDYRYQFPIVVSASVLIVFLLSPRQAKKKRTSIC